MVLENLTSRKDVLTFCNNRIVQLKNDRKKVLSQCEDEYQDEINTKFTAKIEELNYIMENCQ
ncbi:hypothetical protein [Methanolobus halotolerans]|uniref:Uncharacterized protein n=1 Tax=Methanolobus halotolerans TaxID=2052935 RepID=A0A4E0Q5R5_9EURY|nr:hypothetical protein [Methanolobus halotolerans]TGC09530.1 hypothetical protein CUN85_06810 [Methanolobus halotolerans]